MTGWWVHQYYESGGIAMIVSWVFWVLISVILHELAHGWAALWQGDDTPRTHGRMTWNPMVHMGPTSLLMFALIGIAWGLMPVDPSKFRWKRKGRAFVSAAGPAMNIALALLSLTLLALWIRFAGGKVEEPLFSNTIQFFFLGGMLNIVLAAFNLLPVPPLDGSGILSGLSMKWYIWVQNPQFQMAGFFLVIVLFFSGIGTLFFTVAGDVSWFYTETLLSLF